MATTAEDRNEYYRILRLAFPEKRKESERNCPSRTPEARRLYSQGYYSINKLSRDIYAQVYQLAFPDKHKESHRKSNRAWRKNHRGTHYAGKAKARALKRGATIGDTKAIAKIYARAQQWKSWGFDVAVDHKIPLCKGGFHSPDNLQIIYSYENLAKNSSLDYKPRVVFV